MATVRKRGKSWQIDYIDPTGKRVRKNFKKKREAEAELAKRVSLIAEGRYLDVKKEYTTTLGELIEKYKKNFQHQVSFGNWKRFCLENYKDYFGENTRLATIRYVDLETYRNHLRTKPTKNGKVRTHATINKEMSVLRHMFNKAVEWEMLDKSPFERGKTLVVKENNSRLRYLSEEEIERLLTECKKQKHLYRIVFYALNTGMRRGEILSLQWDQVRNGFIYLRKTKTNEPRQIPINADLAGMLKEIRREQELRTKYVFTYKAGRESPAVSIKRIDRAFKAALRRAGIENFRFHDLRHTFASHMVMRGASLKDVQELLGHKSMTMTLRYAHLSQERKKKAVNLLNGLTAYVKSDMSQNVTKLNSASSPFPQVLEITGRGERI